MSNYILDNLICWYSIQIFFVKMKLSFAVVGRMILEFVKKILKKVNYD